MFKLIFVYLITLKFSGNAVGMRSFVPFLFLGLHYLIQLGLYLLESKNEYDNILDLNTRALNLIKQDAKINGKRSD